MVSAYALGVQKGYSHNILIRVRNTKVVLNILLEEVFKASPLEAELPFSFSSVEKQS